MCRQGGVGREYWKETWKGELFARWSEVGGGEVAKERNSEVKMEYMVKMNKDGKRNKCKNDLKIGMNAKKSGRKTRYSTTGGQTRRNVKRP